MRSSPATSADTVVMSGSRSPRPRTTRSAMQPTHGVEATPWFPTCPVPPSTPRRYVSSVYSRTTTANTPQRYAAGTKAILDSYFSGREDYKPEDLIVHKGDYATKAYGQREKSKS
jgi:hypothetical protein